MDIFSEEIGDYIRESIDQSIGLPVSKQTLESKLRASEESQRRLLDQYFYLQSKLREKDEIIDRVRAESSMNAQALKKFVEENQKLEIECTNLVSQCKRWETECSLYDHDREALMEFGNEADEKARVAEIRVHELEEEVSSLSKEFHFYKNDSANQTAHQNSIEGTFTEECLLESLLVTLVGKDQPTAVAFLQANNRVDECQRMLKMWNRLRPVTHKVLALAAEVKTLQNDKEHLRINLHRAEEEVNLLFEQNKILNVENKRLMRQYKKDRQTPDSSGRQTHSTSTKGSKRKSSPSMNGPIEKKLDFGEVDSPRQALSPLENTTETKTHTK